MIFFLKFHSFSCKLPEMWTSYEFLFQEQKCPTWQNLQRNVPHPCWIRWMSPSELSLKWKVLKNCSQTGHTLVTHWSQIVYKYLQPGHKLFTNSLQTVYKLFTTWIQTVYKVFTTCLQTTYKQFTNSIQTLYKISATKNVLNFLQTGLTSNTVIQTVHKMFTNSL